MNDGRAVAPPAALVGARASSETSLSRAALLCLALLSGVCGLAYEVLYSRLLTTYLGDMFYVNAAILTSFLLMLGLGALHAHRFARHLWLIEVLLGLYALLGGLGAHVLQDAFLRHVTPLAASPTVAFGLVFALVAVPAALSGFSVPLFTLLLRSRSADAASAGGAFQSVYAFYNLGAALCVLGVEFALLHLVGLSRTLFIVAAVNFVVALVLLRSRAPVAPPLRVPRDRPGLASAPLARVDRSGLAVLVLGVASGIAQLLTLRLSITLFGPYHENFTLVVALGLVTISLGAWLVRRTGLDLARLAALGALAVPASFLLWTAAIVLWGDVNGLFEGVGALRALRAGVLLVGSGLALTFFGATVPAALREHSGALDAPGRLLALASFGNAGGYVLTLLLLHGHASDRALAAVVGVLTAGVAMAIAGARLPSARGPWRLAGPAGLLLLAVALVGWPAHLLQLSHLHLASGPARRAAESDLRAAAVHRRYGHQVTVLQRANGSEQLVIDGYLSLMIPPEDRPVPQEFTVGVAPAFFAKARRHALVLGVGTGITAGAATHLFERVTAVEINPAVLEVLPHFAARNNHLATHPRTTILLQDGLTLLARQTGQFDAIINTVTSPSFFSSSKLYTKDFFDLAARNLAPGGVYACWFDNEIGPEGAAIILATLRESFPHVVFLLLRAGYLLVIAGREPLAFAPAPAIEPAPLVRAYERLDVALPLDDFIRSLQFGDTAVLQRAGPGAPVNTLDLPALEFALIHHPRGQRAAQSVRQYLGLDFQSSWAEPPPWPQRLAPARAMALMGLNEPAGISLVRETLRSRAFPDDAWNAALPSLLRHASRLPRPESALGWVDVLIEQGRLAQADTALRAWVEVIGGPNPARFRHGLEYARWLQARLVLRGGGALRGATQDEYVTALRGARFAYLDAPGREGARAAWEELVHAALARDWSALAPTAEAVRAAARILPRAEAADLGKTARLLAAAAAGARGDPALALEHLEALAALDPLDSLARIELLLTLPEAAPALDGHRRLLGRLGPAPPPNRALHRLLGLVRQAAGPVRPWEAEGF